QTGLAQAAPIFRDQRQHATRCLLLPLPEQAVEPPLMVFGANRSGVTGEEGALVRRTKIGVDPGCPQRGGAAFEVAGAQRDFCFADFAYSAHRRVALEPVGGNRIGFTGQGFFGAAAQRLLPRPVRVFIDKLGDIGKTPRRTGAGVVEPADDLERQRIADSGRTRIGAGPVAALRRREGRARRPKVELGQALSVQRRKSAEKSEDYAQKSDANSQKQAPPLPWVKMRRSS